MFEKKENFPPWKFIKEKLITKIKISQVRQKIQKKEISRAIAAISGHCDLNQIGQCLHKYWC